MVLACALGAPNTEVARSVRAAATVEMSRSQFVEHRVDGLLDESRPGRAPTICVEQIKDVVVVTRPAVRDGSVGVRARFSGWSCVAG
jgi:hypothetical protein